MDTSLYKHQNIFHLFYFLIQEFFFMRKFAEKLKIFEPKLFLLGKNVVGVLQKKATLELDLSESILKFLFKFGVGAISCVQDGKNCALNL